MAVHTELTPAEAADRVALRELFDAYAHFADRRDAEAQKRSSPTTPASPSTWTAKAASRPTSSTGEKRSRPSSTTSIATKQRPTSTAKARSPSTGTAPQGESYTIAHHLFTEDGNRKIMTASLRYLDTFTKIDQSWYFAERNLILDWSETRSALAPPVAP
jgi:hypothetical protein